MPLNIPVETSKLKCRKKKKCSISEIVLTHYSEANQLQSNTNTWVGLYHSSLLRLSFFFFSLLTLSAYVMNLLATQDKEASSTLRAGQGPGTARRPAELEATHLCLFQTPRGNMKRHSILILSNLDTVEHLQIGI